MFVGTPWIACLLRRASSSTAQTRWRPFPPVLVATGVVKADITRVAPCGGLLHRLTPLPVRRSMVLTIRRDPQPRSDSMTQHLPSSDGQDGIETGNPDSGV